MDKLQLMTEDSWLDRQIHWRRSGDVYAPWQATSGDHVLRLRLGDFPAEMLYTLVVDELEVLCLDSPWPDGWYETVVLREEDHGEDHYSLLAYVQTNGDLVIAGQDEGPSVERVPGSGIRAYEWRRTVAAGDIPRLIEILGGGSVAPAGRPGGKEILDVLVTWLGTHDAGLLEPLLEDQGFTSTFWSRAGD
jgi:hypothetical protein